MEAELSQAISPERHLWRLTAFGQELHVKTADKYSKSWSATVIMLQRWKGKKEKEKSSIVVEGWVF